MSTVNQIRSVNDFTNDAQGQQQYWKAEVESAKKELQPWHKRAEKIVKIYLDNRTLGEESDRNFNLFAANTGILRASLYAKIPKPTVSRRHNNYEDDIARVAATILERALGYELETDHSFDGNAKAIIDDRLITGLGTAWVRYDTDRRKEMVQVTEEVEGLYSETIIEEEREVITDEHTPIDYVHWKDFIYSPARTWGEVRWVGRRVYMTRDEIVGRFGEEAVKDIQFSDEREEKLESSSIDPKNKILLQGEIYEIWDKTSKKVVWMSCAGGKILDEKDDPLDLPGFFPCPRPLIANATTSNLLPLPDYVMVQDQYAELNDLNNRISHLVSACKVAGVYDKEAQEIRKLLEDGRENILIPVERWAAYAERGGIARAIEWLPIEQVANVLIILQKARESVKAQLYELTGISDILRGSSSPYETASAQKIKSQYASLRLSAVQQEVAVFFSELISRKAFLMAKFYEPERLLLRAGSMSPYDQQYIMPALELLRNELTMSFRVEVSVDSLQMPNFDTEKEQRAEAIGAISSFLQTALPAAKESPELAPLLLGMLRWGVAGYRATKDIEGLFDKALADLEQQKNQPKPNPEAQAAQVAAQAEQQKFQLQQADLQLRQTEIQNNFTLEQAKIMLERERIALEREKLQINAQISQYEIQADQLIKDRNADIKRETAQVNAMNQVRATDKAQENAVIEARVAMRGQDLQALNTTAEGPNFPAQ